MPLRQQEAAAAFGRAKFAWQIHSVVPKIERIVKLLFTTSFAQFALVTHHFSHPHLPPLLLAHPSGLATRDHKHSTSSQLNSDRIGAAPIDISLTADIRRKDT